jgi:hypothetical protein
MLMACRSVLGDVRPKKASGRATRKLGDNFTWSKPNI